MQPPLCCNKKIDDTDLCSEWASFAVMIHKLVLKTKQQQQQINKEINKKHLQNFVMETSLKI